MQVILTSNIFRIDNLEDIEHSKFCLHFMFETVYLTHDFFLCFFMESFMEIWQGCIINRKTILSIYSRQM